MSKILVTGGCGFLGSHLCEYFKQKGWEVTAYDNLTKLEMLRVPYWHVNKVREYNLKLLKEKNIEIVKGDVRDFSRLFEACKGIDFIVHTAAQPAMTISIENPALDFYTNAEGTFNVLEVARRLDLPTVYTSTIHIYGNGLNHYLLEEKTRFSSPLGAVKETDPILTGTLTPLHASKRTGELYCQTYMDTYGLKVAVFRLTGIYGPRQFGGEDHGWVANFAIRLLLGLPIRFYGSGKQVRDILYVKDACRAFWCFWKRQKTGIYNIGGDKEYAVSLQECVAFLEHILKVKAKIELAPKRQGDLWWFICDITKAKKELGWCPKVPPFKGLKKLVWWLKTVKTPLFKTRWLR